MNVDRLKRLLREKAVSGRQLFYYMDNNRDNQISLVEFKYGLGLAGIKASYEEVLKLFSDCDEDSDGRITWKEFVHVIFNDDAEDMAFSPSSSQTKLSKSTSWQTLERLRKESPDALSKTRDLRRLDDISKVLKGFCKSKRLLYGTVIQSALDMFGVADRDANGSLSEKEFHSAMNRLGLGLSNEESKNLFDLIDEDGSGQISFHEFHSALKKRHHVRGKITHHISTGNHDVTKNKGNGYRKNKVPHYMLATENWNREHEGHVSKSVPKEEDKEAFSDNVSDNDQSKNLLDAVRAALKEGSGMKDMKRRVSKIKSVNLIEMAGVLEDLGFQFSKSQLESFMQNFARCHTVGDVIRVMQGDYDMIENDDVEDGDLDLKVFVKKLAKEVHTLRRTVDRLILCDRHTSRKKNESRESSGRKSSRPSRSALKNYNVDLITNPPVTRTEKRMAETKKLRSFLFREREYSS